MNRLAKKRLMWGSVICIGAVALVIITCYLLVSGNASGRTYDDVADVPRRPYAMLLATSPLTRAGAHNWYFDNRIIAAEQLYKAGKIDTIIASGGNYTASEMYGCDEPKAIVDSLVARGVPADRILLDYNGTRTLKSIENARNAYHLDSLIFISQKYHNERAIYLADSRGLDAIGYNAEPSPLWKNRLKNDIRELFARVKMFIDLL